MSTMNLVDQFFRSQDLFAAVLDQVRDDQWSNPTPCTEWNVRVLVNHMTYEDLWLPDLFTGRTIAEVGTKYDGDVLGDSPQQSYKDAVAKTREPLSAPGALERTVHLSYGDTKGEGYLISMLSDHLIHSWDLAKGIGADYQPDEEIVKTVWDWMSPRADWITGSSVFGSRVEVAEDAPLFVRLLGLSGRNSNWQSS